jgi:lipopolysaccharide transport system permease protein
MTLNVDGRFNLMQDFSITPQEMAASFWRNRSLTQTLVHREVVGRYRGSFLGLFWSFFHPLFMLAVYTFVFSVVFQAKWGKGSDSQVEFSLVLFSGLIVFNFFAECINRAPGLIVGRVNYVKKVVFPLEIWAWVSVGSALFHFGISLLVWLLFYLLAYGLPSYLLLLLPFVFLPPIFLAVGLTWFLASLGVYLRDIAQITPILTTVLLFLSPIFYPIEAVPEQLRFLLGLNPLAPALAQVRGVLMWGDIPDFRIWLIYLMISILIAWLGFAWFQKSRKGFADVL